MLARNGRPVMGDLRYLADTKLAAFTTPLARGADRRGARRSSAIAGARRARSRRRSSSCAATRDDGGYRADYGSRLRDGAGLLALVSEAGRRARADPADLARHRGRSAASSRTTSTQENAWMVLAAQALARDAEAIALSVDGTPRKGALYRTFRDRRRSSAGR